MTAEAPAYGSAAVWTPPVTSATGASRTTPASVAIAAADSLSRAPAISVFQVACMNAAPSARAKAESGTAGQAMRPASQVHTWFGRFSEHAFAPPRHTQ